MNYKLYSLLVFVIIFSSCSSESFEITPESMVDGAAPYEEGAIPHPQPDMMPHADVEAIDLVLIDGSEIISDLPENLQLLYSYLNDEKDQFNQKKLSLYVSNEYSFHVASKDESTLVMLDEKDNRFFQYDLQTDKYIDLAPRGRGPGDIMFTKEMQFHDNRAYIAMQGFRISVFDCHFEECEYDYTINSEFNSYSIAPEKDRLTILGLPPFGRDQDPDPENIDQHIIHQINNDGDVEHSYSPVYKHNNPLTREVMNAGGKIRAFPKSDSVVMVQSLFPYIYIFNSETSLVEKYRIPDFQIGYYDEIQNPDGSIRGRYRHNDNTNISHATKIDDEWMLLQMRERRDLYWVDRTLHGDQWYSYYVFNMNSRELYKIGEDEKKNLSESRTIHVTENGLVVNQQGILNWVSL